MTLNKFGYFNSDLHLALIIYHIDIQKKIKNAWVFETNLTKTERYGEIKIFTNKLIYKIRAKNISCAFLVGSNSGRGSVFFREKKN